MVASSNTTHFQEHGKMKQIFLLSFLLFLIISCGGGGESSSSKVIPKTHTLKYVVDGENKSFNYLAITAISNPGWKNAYSLPLEESIYIHSGELFIFSINWTEKEPQKATTISIYIDGVFKFQKTLIYLKDVDCAGYVLDEISEPYLIKDYSLSGITDPKLPNLLSPSDYTIQVEHMTEAEVASQTRYFFGN
jgi:hypothetical protein